MKLNENLMEKSYILREASPEKDDIKISLEKLFKTTFEKTNRGYYGSEYYLSGRNFMIEVNTESRDEIRFYFTCAHPYDDANYSYAKGIISKKNLNKGFGHIGFNIWIPEKGRFSRGNYNTCFKYFRNVLELAQFIADQDKKIEPRKIHY